MFHGSGPVEGYRARLILVSEKPKISINQHSQKVGLRKTTKWHDLALKAYKGQITWELKPLDHSKC